MMATPRITPPVRRGTRLHIINEVFDWQRDDWSPLPIELAILNVGTAHRRTLDDFDESEIIAVQIQFCEDATIIFRIVPVIEKEEVQQVLRRAGYGERGLL